MVIINLSFLFYLFCSFLFIIIQTSVIPTSSLGSFTPDFNLILIICMAIRAKIPYLFTLAMLNGFLMDIFSIGALGLYTLTRFAVFVTLKMGMRNFNYNSENIFLLPLTFFTGTLLMYLLLFVLFLFKQYSVPQIGIELVLYQAITNAVVGFPIIMLLRKLDGISET